MNLKQRLHGKRFGLVLSAGYFGFFGHAGFVEGLLSAGLKPSAWAGTSAGGLVAALHAARLPQQRVAQLLLGLKRSHFWDPDVLGVAVDAVRSGARSTGLLKGQAFQRLLTENLPAHTFEACAEPLLLLATNLSTSSAHPMQHGELATAIRATCAYPGMFQAVERDGHLLWDGGLVDKAPALALAQTFELDALLVHFLPSRPSASKLGGPFAYLIGMAAGMAALRKDHFRLQLELLQERGVEVHVVTSHLPPVSPGELHRGADAYAAGRTAAESSLAAPPQPWTPAD